MAKTPAAAPKCVYVKVTLNDVRPPIWRRLRVPVSWHLGKLSDAILRGMGWLRDCPNCIRRKQVLRCSQDDTLVSNSEPTK